MPKRRGQSNYYTGRGGGRDADLLRMLNARLTMSSARVAELPGRIMRGARVPQHGDQVIAQAERRPHRVTPRMSFNRRLVNYTHGQTMPTGKQARRLAHKARIAGRTLDGRRLTARERALTQISI